MQHYDIIGKIIFQFLLEYHLKVILRVAFLEEITFVYHFLHS